MDLVRRYHDFQFLMPLPCATVGRVRRIRSARCLAAGATKKNNLPQTNYPVTLEIYKECTPYRSEWFNARSDGNFCNRGTVIVYLDFVGQIWFPYVKLS